MSSCVSVLISLPLSLFVRLYSIWQTLLIRVGQNDTLKQNYRGHQLHYWGLCIIMEQLGNEQDSVTDNIE